MIALFALAAHTPYAEAQQQPMPVTVVVARQSEVRQQISVVGTLAAREEVQVHARTAGQEIQDILVEVGETVEQGQPMALFDDTDARLDLDRNAVNTLRAKAATAVEAARLDIATVAEREARARLDRSQALHAKAVVSEQVLDDARSAYDRAAAETVLSRNALALAQIDERLIAQEQRQIELAIERSILRATAPGLVLERNALVGDITSSAVDPLFRIARDSRIEFLADVVDTAFVRLSAGMPAEIMVAGRDLPVFGTVRLNAAQLDPETRSGTIRIELDESDGLVPGVFAHGVIDLATRMNVLLPGQSVSSAGGVHRVHVVNDGVVETRTVNLGVRQDEGVEVLDGVTDGEMIVLKAGSFLKDEDSVDPIILSENGLPIGQSQAVSMGEFRDAAHR